MDFTKDKFENNAKPWRPKKILTPLKDFLCKIFSKGNKYDVETVDCDDLKPPFIVICNHSSNLDFPVVYKFTRSHPTNWVVSIEEFVGRDWLMRSAGCFYKRKFTNDIQVVKNILTVIKEYGNNLVIYPEARFSLCGISEKIDNALGKLVKLSKVPVVFLTLRGAFLSSPQWNKSPVRRLRLKAQFKQIVTSNELDSISSQEIQRRIQDCFNFDDYQWQYDNKIRITSKFRAHNIHKILYQCPICGTEFSMDSKHSKLWCNHCGANWEMNEFGRLIRLDGQNVFEHVPDWYNWEKQNVKQLVYSGNYSFLDNVRLELLWSPKRGYKVASHDISYTHDYNGFTVKGKLVDGTNFFFNRSCESMESCHIEFNFKKRGDTIELCNDKITYFVFPKNYSNVVTKIHFATEFLHSYVLEYKHAQNISIMPD